MESTELHPVDGALLDSANRPEETGGAALDLPLDRAEYGARRLVLLNVGPTAATVAWLGERTSTGEGARVEFNVAERIEAETEDEQRAAWNRTEDARRRLWLSEPADFDAEYPEPYPEPQAGRVRWNAARRMIAPRTFTNLLDETADDATVSRLRATGPLWLLREHASSKPNRWHYAAATVALERVGAEVTNEARNMLAEMLRQECVALLENIGESPTVEALNAALLDRLKALESRVASDLSGEAETNPVAVWCERVPLEPLLTGAAPPWLWRTDFARLLAEALWPELEVDLHRSRYPAAYQDETLTSLAKATSPAATGRTNPGQPGQIEIVFPAYEDTGAMVVADLDFGLDVLPDHVVRTLARNPSAGLLVGRMIDFLHYRVKVRWAKREENPEVLHWNGVKHFTREMAEWRGLKEIHPRRVRQVAPILVTLGPRLHYDTDGGLKSGGGKLVTRWDADDTLDVAVGWPLWPYHYAKKRGYVWPSDRLVAVYENEPDLTPAGRKGAAGAYTLTRLVLLVFRRAHYYERGADLPVGRLAFESGLKESTVRALLHHWTETGTLARVGRGYTLGPAEDRAHRFMVSSTRITRGSSKGGRAKSRK